MEDIRFNMNEFMDNEVFLSVIVPVYNVEGYLERCYQSINMQKIKDIELIFVNDNSTDGSLEVLRKLSKNDKRIIIINKTKDDVQGAGSSRNIGIEASRGRYLYFMDADDYLSEAAFEVFKKNVELNPCQVLLFGFTAVVDDTFSKIFESDFVSDNYFSFAKSNEKLSTISKIYFSNNLYAVWNKVYLREFIVKKNIKFPNTRTAQDALFNIDVFKTVETLSWISDHLYFYIVNRTDSNQNTPKSKFLDEYNLLKKLELLSKDDSKNNDWNSLINSERHRIVNNEIKFLYRQNPSLAKRLILNNIQLNSIIQDVDFKVFLKDKKQFKKIIYYVFFKYKMGLDLYFQLIKLKDAIN